ncbi:hypothetical protein BGW37DRAFT_202845 [Umbelopsis sp. PMI_123]|nr:hypothetical protein BGW37DRAFT_202845 [Umbelopsis sp. PMI_123]
MSNSTITDCIACWKKSSGRGSDILRTAAAQRDGSFNYGQDLLEVINELRACLDSLYTQFDDYLKEKDIAIQIPSEKGSGDGMVESVTLFKACLDMLDQDFIMKETIQAVLSASDSSIHPQHLVGFSSVWSCEPYVDNRQIDALLNQAL